jgi:hypothetical protein
MCEALNRLGAVLPKVSAGTILMAESKLVCLRKWIDSYFVS